MALPSSGAISMNQMHVEVGGSSGSTVGLNDTDIRALISKSSGATMSFNEWYGASSIDDVISITAGEFAETSEQNKYPTTYRGYLFDMSKWNGNASSAPLGSISDSSISLGGTTYTVKGVFSLANSIASNAVVVLNGNVGTGNTLATVLGVDYLKSGSTTMIDLTATNTGTYDSTDNYTYWAGGLTTAFTNGVSYNLTFTD
jgi:hypothetical protein